MNTGNTRKLSYRKDDRTMRPVYGCPDNFRESLTTPTATFRKFLMGFCSIEPINVHAKVEVRSFTRSWDNSDWNFGCGANPNLGEGEAVGGRGWSFIHSFTSVK